MTVSQISQTPVPRAARRAIYGVFAAALLVALAKAHGSHPVSWWQVAAFGLGPDVAFLLTLTPGLERGRMHPRAVPPYNVLHRPAGPVVLAGLALAGVVPSRLIVGALAWGVHIAWDRAIGYGLRSRDGWQR